MSPAVTNEFKPQIEAYSEPKPLGYAYAFDQATQAHQSPLTTPSLPGEVID